MHYVGTTRISPWLGSVSSRRSPSDATCPLQRAWFLRRLAPSEPRSRWPRRLSRSIKVPALPALLQHEQKQPSRFHLGRVASRFALRPTPHHPGLTSSAPLLAPMGQLFHGLLSAVSDCSPTGLARAGARGGAVVAGTIIKKSVTRIDLPLVPAYLPQAYRIFSPSPTSTAPFHNTLPKHHHKPHSR